MSLKERLANILIKVIGTGNEAIPLWTECDENIVLGNIWENPEMLSVEGKKVL